ncbi:MAG: hypothetical protein JO144_17390 [Actinobacteria bacterium]|nr:hypothetical protein [Actinomycetota bacterium]
MQHRAAAGLDLLGGHSQPDAGQAGLPGQPDRLLEDQIEIGRQPLRALLAAQPDLVQLELVLPDERGDEAGHGGRPRAEDSQLQPRAGVPFPVAQLDELGMVEAALLGVVLGDQDAGQLLDLRPAVPAGPDAGGRDQLRVAAQVAPDVGAHGGEPVRLGDARQPGLPAQRRPADPVAGGRGERLPGGGQGVGEDQAAVLGRGQPGEQRQQLAQRPRFAQLPGDRKAGAQVGEAAHQQAAVGGVAGPPAVRQRPAARVVGRIGPAPAGHRVQRQQRGQPAAVGPAQVAGVPAAVGLALQGAVVASGRTRRRVEPVELGGRHRADAVQHAEPDRAGEIGRRHPGRRR